ncbi:MULTISPECIES: 3'(2'),5'-bisphosphate nucleotidase CysQ [unclassified Halomonas]|uniref:3'(2'),5'-bisphosphate nucleotidase CysQ n=1 Tax=unclassified Halomonas TaxID=2609666 RepID=UPI0005FA43B7|nr:MULTISPECIES: 3'(2'),5'-bisphosphate nucleotidase CysQ [unclassified Halomonas]MCO7218157.1 3'(2'),5'-bisphosphate nucleotidase CysQ [Halomonas sp. OfavH-34-E]
MPVSLSSEHKDALVAGVEEAGRLVLEIYQRDFEVEHKDDDSPLTEADLAAHHALVALLGRLTPEVPVLSEESGEIATETRLGWSCYWLVDPLDGTKEFVNRNGEFTLNVALIEHGVPVLGVVHAPVLGVTWFGEQDNGAWRSEGESRQPIHARELPDPAEAPWVVVGSRRHGAEAFEAFCARLPATECTSMGSSLKLCLVAEGKADLYPRLAPTCEWDTAAAQAVVTAAGGLVLDAETLEPLRCNRGESLLNPFFVVCGQRDARWEQALVAALAQ